MAVPPHLGNSEGRSPYTVVVERRFDMHLFPRRKHEMPTAEITVGMSAREVRKLLGKPTARMTGADFMKHLGGVVGSADAVSHFSSMDHWLYRFPSVEYQIVLVGGKVTNVEKVPLGVEEKRTSRAEGTVSVSFDEKVNLPPKWAEELGGSSVTLQGPPEEFFAQQKLPPLWLNVSATRLTTKRESPAAQEVFLRLAWYIAYFHHPVASAVVRTLKTALGDNHNREALLRGLALYLPELLTHEDTEVRETAAELAWQCDDASLKQIIVVLSNTGAIPSGIDARRGREAAELLRNYCPPERMAFFQGLVQERFAPVMAGTENNIPSANVRYKVKAQKPGSGEEVVYTYTYESPTKRRKR